MAQLPARLPFVREGCAMCSGLCCHLQGGLPTFVDVGASFSAAAVAEDNLIGMLTPSVRCI